MFIGRRQCGWSPLRSRGGAGDRLCKFYALFSSCCCTFTREHYLCVKAAWIQSCKERGGEGLWGRDGERPALPRVTRRMPWGSRCSRTVYRRNGGWLWDGRDVQPCLSNLFFKLTSVGLQFPPELRKTILKENIFIHPLSPWLPRDAWRKKLSLFSGAGIDACLC